MMKRLIVVIALAAPFAALAQEPYYLGDQRLAVIDDPLRVEFRTVAALTREKIRQTIAMAATRGDWKVFAETDGRFELTRTVNSKHFMRIEVVYDASGYTVRYLDSNNLLYQEMRGSGRQVRAIHYNYNVWIKELAAAINSTLGVSAVVAAPTPIAGNKPQATEPRPPSGWIGQRNH